MFSLARFSLRLIRLWRMRERVNMRIHLPHIALSSVLSQRETREKGKGGEII
jgi:hypothetical protein